MKILLEWVEGIMGRGEEVDMGNIGHSFKEFYYEGSRETEANLRKLSKIFSYF